MKRSKHLLIAIFSLIFSQAFAQTKGLYDYQDLSKFFYQKQKDSLRKAWVCPSIYKDKTTQKKYKEIWDQRTDFIISAIENDAYVHDKEVYGYVDGIVDQIMQANRKSIPVKPFLLIDRSSSVNAYAIGNNILAVNLGLIAFVNSKEELALAIAHELSHNVLAHAENAMKQRAEWLTSDEYNKSLNAVLDSKYERLSRLKKVLENFTFDRSKHQRYHEGEADSMAIVLLKNCNIGFDAAFFLRLDSADIMYKKALQSPIKNYFTSYELPFEESWITKRTKGLSSKNYNFRDTTSIADSLKTHPDCSQRYERTLSYSTKNLSLSIIPTNIQEKANKMIVWNMYKNMSLTPCLYRILLEKDRGQKDSWYDFMVSNIFSGLYYADKGLSRFNAIGIIQKEYVSKQYFELQTMFEQIPRETLEQYCRKFQNASFWNGLLPAEKGLKSFLYSLTLAADNSDKDRAKAAKDYMTNHGNSMYCEVTDLFDKK